MIKYILAIVLLATPALAQQPQPAFVPFTIDQATYQGLMTYLGDVPAKYANPILGVLIQKEQEAIKAAAKPMGPGESEPQQGPLK